MQQIDSLGPQARPVTTLFMLSSVDGKISSGADDSMDFDKDLPKIHGVREGLHQYHEIEQTTDPWSLCSGRTQAKIGANVKQLEKSMVADVNFVVLDNYHLTKYGVEYLCSRYYRVFVITTNCNHPSHFVACDNLEILAYDSFRLGDVLHDLYDVYGCEKLTIQI